MLIIRPCFVTAAFLCSVARCYSLFAAPELAIPEARPAHQFQLNKQASQTGLHRTRKRSLPNGQERKRNSKEELNTIFSGVHPVINITWGGRAGYPDQVFTSFVDTGSSDTFVFGDNVQCASVPSRTPLNQSACGFGPLYNLEHGNFTNITSEMFSIWYFPEFVSLRGDIGYTTLKLGDITISNQEVALINWAAWEPRAETSGLLGLSYPSLTAAKYRDNGTFVQRYSPVFTSMIDQGLLTEPVFSLAIDRVPLGTPARAPAGQIAFGGLVSDEYYAGPFTSVPIEVEIQDQRSGGPISSYAITTELLYGLANGTVISGGSWQSVVDSGTAGNYVPASVADAINANFVPPAVYNSTLQYWTVDCDAKPPFAAYKVGGKTMPMDPRDMIVRSLNGLDGYEDVCFSAFANGGDPNWSPMVVGEVWQRSYVVAYDQGRTMLHFADRRPY